MNELSEITVLTLEQATVVPYLTYKMAMDGMNILRLEHPIYGDPNRMIGDDVLGEKRMNSYYLCINSGKKSVTVDLANPKGKKVLKRIISNIGVDVFITNQLPRNYGKLGIDYNTLRSIKEDIIWLGITGFGPDNNEAAYDPILQARSGLMDLTGDPKGEPQVLGIPLPDMGTSEHAYGLIMRALYKRALTGKGAEINLSMLESSVSWLTVPITMVASFKKNMTRRGNTHDFFCPVSVYETKDGFIYLAVGNDRQWQKMVSNNPFKSLDQEKYQNNSGRINDVEALNSKIKAITVQHTSSDLMSLFKSLSIPVSKINSVSDVLNDPIIKDKLLYTVDPKTKKRITLAPPPNKTSFLTENKGVMTFPPRFGEHNEEILGKIGYSKQELDQLKAEGCV